MERLTLDKMKAMYLETRIIKQEVIAIEMGISVRTVKKHISSIYSKLQMNDKTDLFVQLALCGELNAANDCGPDPEWDESQKDRRGAVA